MTLNTSVCTISMPQTMLYTYLMIWGMQTASLTGQTAEEKEKKSNDSCQLF